MYSRESEAVTLTRNVVAVAVPSGDQVILREGWEADITQALGGSFTVYVRGNLYRIEGKDAEALGREPLPGPDLPEDASDDSIQAVIWDQLKTCFDPEIPINIVDLGLVYECRVESLEAGSKVVIIKMTLTAPGCGMGDYLVDDVRAKVGAIPTVTKVDVELVFDPPWNRSMMSEAAQLEAGLY
jgi:probable FeS assembly SUF system protein SufT